MVSSHLVLATAMFAMAPSHLFLGTAIKYNALFSFVFGHCNVCNGPSHLFLATVMFAMAPSHLFLATVMFAMAPSHLFLAIVIKYSGPLSSGFAQSKHCCGCKPRVATAPD